METTLSKFKLIRGGGGGGKMTMILTMTMAKISKYPWSKLAIFDHDHGQNCRDKWSKLVILTIDHGQNRECHGHGQLF